MDAKPQRPLRSMRTFNNENVLPDGPLPKTIHHRNKSSPALSNIAGGVGSKPTAKRTAFGDLSNIVNHSRVGKDNGLISNKNGSNLNSKGGSIAGAEMKTAAFLRPAQRPLSVSSSLKNFMSNTATASLGGSTQQTQEQVQPNAIQNAVISRKTITKRATTIFKDIPLPSVKEQDVTEPLKSSPEQPPLPVSATIPTTLEIPQFDSPVRLPPPADATIPLEPEKEESSSRPDLEAVRQLDAHLYIPARDLETQSSQQSYSAVREENLNDQLGSQPVYEHQSEPHSLYEVVEEPADYAKIQSLPEPYNSIAHTTVPLTSVSIQRNAQPEHEEYWEGEEEDGYDDDAYVTARSFRSKGENTTGGATTVLAPRMSQKVRREIEESKALVEATRTPEDIEDEAFDTSMVAEYGDEIFEYMRQLEAKMTPNPHYMDSQHEIQWSMRSVLMDWLVQVHLRFNLLPETLFLCVNYIDRFLSSKVVSLGKLQLVGATAIFIAAKYEEINCPSVQEIVYMVDSGYNVEEILKAERFMLTMLQFELGWPGPMSFLRRISKADDYDLETRTLAKYFLEVTVMDERFIGSPPSFTAAASHCLARMMLRKGSWTPHHVYYSGYTFSQLKPLLQLLLDCCEDPRKHHSAVYNKYCDKRYKRASIFVETEIRHGFYLPQSPAAVGVFHQSFYTYYGNGQY